MPSSACSGSFRALHSFPTRRSSDLSAAPPRSGCALFGFSVATRPGTGRRTPPSVQVARGWRRIGRSVPLETVGSTINECAAQSCSVDRKSTRLNSSHGSISYAVFCLLRLLPCSTLFPYTTLFRSLCGSASQRMCSFRVLGCHAARHRAAHPAICSGGERVAAYWKKCAAGNGWFNDKRMRRTELLCRSEEHTSELQSR